MKNRNIRYRRTIPTLLIAVTLGCFPFLPAAQAVVPPPDGGYPGLNTAEGTDALKNLTTGTTNTAVGGWSLFSNTEGSYNTAVGAGTLLFNVGDQSNGQGLSNTAVGAAALLFNTTGNRNTATGFQALASNTTGFQNTATGVQALQNNTTGDDNTANGFQALASNATGSDNTANGQFALQINTTGSRNTANGAQALGDNTTGSDNTATGFQALLTNTTGNGNVAVGYAAGIHQTTGSNNVYIGHLVAGVAGESNTCYIRSIWGGTIIAGLPVLVNANDKLGTVTSSSRFKEAIQPMEQESEALFALEPVSFRYKKEIDPEGISQFGLVAEDVEKVNPALIVRDKEGKPYSVRYDQVNALLLNEFLKEHRKVQKQEATIAQLKKEMQTVVARLKEHDSRIQRVSAQIEISKAVGQTALNNR